MVNSFPFALFVGLVLGYLAALGIGGGSLLILWLTMVIGMDGAIAQTVNLLFFLICAGSVSLVRLKKGTLQLRGKLPGILAGCATAALFSYIGGVIHTELARKLFGGLLLITGLKELFYRPRKAK